MNIFVMSAIEVVKAIITLSNKNTTQPTKKKTPPPEKKQHPTPPKAEEPIPPKPFKPVGVAEKYFAAKEEHPEYILMIPTPSAENDKRLWDKLLATVNLNTTTMIHPQSLTNELRELLEEYVERAGGYTVELSALFDYALAGEFEAGLAYFRSHTKVELYEVIGNVGVTQLRRYFSFAENMSLEGNLHVLRAYAKNEAVAKLLPSGPSLGDLHEVVTMIMVADAKAVPRVVTDSLFWISKYADLDLIPLVKVNNTKGNKYNTIKRLRMMEGLRDGLLLDYPVFTNNNGVNDFVNKLYVLAKFVPTAKQRTLLGKLL